MKKNLRYLLIAILLSLVAVLFAIPNANATNLRIMHEKSAALKTSPYYVTINSLLGPNLTLPVNPEVYERLIVSTSALLPEIPVESEYGIIGIRAILNAMKSVQQRIDIANHKLTYPNFYSYHALQWRGDSALVFLSIIKQAFDIAQHCRTTDPVVHTVYGNSILPISLLAGIESHLGFKTVYVNILEKGNIISNEFGGGSWFCALGPIRSQFKKVVSIGSINVNIYESLARYAQHIKQIPGPTYGTKSDSFYIASDDVEKIGASLEAIGQKGRPLIAFDLEGNQIEDQPEVFTPATPPSPSTPISIASTVLLTAPTSEV